MERMTIHDYNLNIIEITIYPVGPSFLGSGQFLAQWPTFWQLKQVERALLLLPPDPLLSIFMLSSLEKRESFLELRAALYEL